VTIVPGDGASMVTARLARDGRPARRPPGSGRLVLRSSLILHDDPMLNAVLVHDHEEFWLDEEFWASWHPEVFAQPEVFTIMSP
jgi:hypothetical protein